MPNFSGSEPLRRQYEKKNPQAFAALKIRSDHYSKVENVR